LSNLSLHNIKFYLNEFINYFNGNVAYLYILIFLIAAFLIFIKSKKRLSLKKAKSKNYINELSWRDFEVIIAMFYKKKGFKVTLEGGLGGDGGIDILLEKKGQKQIIQCKHWKKNSVGVGVIREMFGVMVAESAIKVIIITSGRFTKESYKFAFNKPIELIDGNKLNTLMKS
jgi:restriction system protein